MSFTIQRILGSSPVIVLGLLLLAPAPGLAQTPRPDLVVNFLGEPPATALPGDSFEVRTRVLNPSAVAAGASITRFDLVRTPAVVCPPALPQCNVKNLKGGQNISELAPGTSGVSRVTLAIYSDTLPATYFLRACANGSTPKIPESNTTNNCRQSTGTITVLAVPDLRMTGISNPPSSVLLGQDLVPATTYTVQNTGGVSAGPSLVKFSLVPAAGMPGARIDLKAAASDKAVGALAPGATFSHTLPLAVKPETVPGTYHLEGCANSGSDPDRVPEGDRDNNCKMSPGTVLVALAPDLFVKNVTVTAVPLTVGQGESLAIEVLVKNAGPVDAAASTLKLRLVPAVGDPLAKNINLKGDVAVRGLRAGTQLRLDATPEVDDDTVPGSYLVEACADYNKEVPESLEKNNCARAPETVTVTGLPLSPVDLEVTGLTPPPATRLPGETFPLTATVRNHGTQASPVTASKFYLVNALVNPTLRKNLKGVQTLDPIAAGATDATEVTVQVFPDTVPGSYFLQACADGDKQLHEINENDNCRTSPSAITVSPVPDLVVTQVGNPPAAILPGKGFPITETVKNEGPVGSLASVVKFSLVSTVDPAIVFELNGSHDVPALALNEIFDDSGTVTVRHETLPGSYFVKACADAGKVILEGDEDDNCKLSAGAVEVGAVADLFINPVRLPPLPVTVARGSQILLGAVVRNQGLATAGASSLKFSLVVTPGAAQKVKLPEAVPVAAVAPGARRVAEAMVTIPGDTTLGAYFVEACVDTANVVLENSDANNCDTSDDPIQVTGP